MNIYREIYYWIYFNTKKNKSQHKTAETACLLFGIFQMLNIITLLVLMRHYLILSIEVNSIYGGIILAIIVYIVNKKFLYSKHNEIEKIYSALTIQEQRKGKLTCCLYLIFSAVLFYYCGVNLN